MKRLPTGIIEMGYTCVESEMSPTKEHFPLWKLYPENLVRRMNFTAGAGLGWRISAIETPREKPAPWKFIVITGAPSWAEYWAPMLAALPKNREMLVINRPGFAASEPQVCVGDIRLQAAALQPVLQNRPLGQKIVLIGHSYGAAIATLMAAENPGKVHSLVALSGYFGEFGVTARRLVTLGSKFLKLIPRDLRHAVMEVSNQGPQLAYMREAMSRLRIPIHVIHGDRDDYAPIEVAERLVREVRTRRPIRFEKIPGGDHFIHDGPADVLLQALERCVPARWSFKAPKVALPKVAPMAGPAGQAA